jgi:hypothetical protein
LVCPHLASGWRLIPLLRGGGHHVTRAPRSQQNFEQLRALGTTNYQPDDEP